MRLFGHRDYRLVIKGRDGDCHRCGSAGLIIIVGVKPFAPLSFKKIVIIAIHLGGLSGKEYGDDL